MATSFARAYTLTLALLRSGVVASPAAAAPFAYTRGVDLFNEAHNAAGESVTTSRRYTISRRR